MRVWLARAPQGEHLIPTDEVGERLIRRLAPGECVTAEIVRPRSWKWLKLYFGLCDQIGQNQDPKLDEHAIDAKIRVWAGHFEVMGHVEAEVGGEKVLCEIRTPKSIAFKNLSHDEWFELWPSLELAMREHYGVGPQITPIN